MSIIIINYLYFSLLIFVEVCNGEKKQWIPNTNYNNPSNWNPKRLPCPGDRVIVSSDEPVAIYIQVNATIKELILPKTGEMILGDNVILSFGAEGPASDVSHCKGVQESDVEFNNVQEKNWFDPDNWDSVSPDGSIYRNLLPAEQIPCYLDTIYFPPSSSFKVKLELPAPLTIQGFKYGEIDFNSTGLQAFLRSPSGQLQFRQGSEKARFTFQNTPCPNTYGCSCGNDREEILSKICNFQSKNCLVSPCPGPVIPSGGCCTICGGYLWLDYNKNHFDLSKLSTFLQKYLAEKGYSEVSFNSSVLSNNKIQIILVDRGGGRVASEVAYNLVSQLLEGSLGVDHVEVFASEGPSIGPAASHTGMNSGSTAGVIIAVIIILALIALLTALVYKKRRIVQGFQFGKFFETEKPSEIELGAQATFNRAAEPEASIRGFDNPMYDTPSKGEDIIIDDEAAAPPQVEIKKTMKMDMHIVNPVYQAMEEMENDNTF